jgi:soluble lytic murein transglycosylase-like protein
VPRPTLLIVGRLTLAAVLAVLLPAAAHAQIYSWRDANGNLVLSDRPHQGAERRTFAVPQASGVRVTRGLSARGDQYEDLIVGHATLHKIRPDLVRAVIQVESGFNPRAVSPKGALGLMQLMPATARQLQVRNAFDPEENIRGGVAYLRQLLDRYEGNEQLALAAYNAGPGAVDRHGQAVPPYPETQHYVSKISGLVGGAIAAPGTIRVAKTKGTPVAAGTAETADAADASMTAAARAPSTAIYRVVDVVNGREVVRYTDKRPVD